MTLTTDDNNPVEGETDRGLSSRPVQGELIRQFMERVVAEGRAVATRSHAGAAVPEVDWERIWSAGAGADSSEGAIGRMVNASYIEAREIAAGPALGSGWRRSSDRPPIPAPIPLSPAPLDPITEPVPTVSAARTASIGDTAPVTLPWLSPTPSPIGPPTQTVVPLVGVPGHGGHRAALGNRRVDKTLPVATEVVEQSPVFWSVWTWVRNVGFIILLFVAWQLWGTGIAQHHDQSALRSQFETSIHHATVSHSASTPALVAPNVTVPSPAEGSVVAHLTLPAIGIDQYVVSGTAAGDLAKGPGHYIGTAMPGQAGNVAIAGHRTTHGAPFLELGHVKVGDKIYLTSTSGATFTYVVAQPPDAISPGNVSVINNFGDNRITLTTCNPEYSASQRLVVVGLLDQKGLQPAASAKPTAYHVVDPATASWDWGLLPVVLLEVALLVGLGLANRRIGNWYGRAGKWLILTPVWVAGFYIIFQTFTSFFPPSL